MLKTVVTTTPLCLRKLWVLSSVHVIVSKCRYVALHFLMKIRGHLHRSSCRRLALHPFIGAVPFCPI